MMARGGGPEVAPSGRRQRQCSWGTRTHTRARVRAHTRAHTYMCTHTRTHTYIQVHTHTHAHIHTYTRSHTLTHESERAVRRLRCRNARVCLGGLPRSTDDEKRTPLYQDAFGCS